MSWQASPQPPVAGLLLAAGGSRRLGYPKQLLLWQGTPLLLHTLHQGLPLQEKGLVRWHVLLGAYSELVTPLLKGYPVQRLYHPLWRRGQGFSLQKGLHHLQLQGRLYRGVLLCVCDQPYLSSAYLEELVQRFLHLDCPIASAYENTIGPPACLPWRHVPLLQATATHQGAKEALRALAAQLVTLPFPQGAIDLDRWEDVASAANLAAQIGQQLVF